MSDTAQPHSTLRSRNQLTLPASIKAALRVEEGDEILFWPESDGSVRLIAARLIPADQAWFWTEEWQAGEREFEANRAAGLMSGPMSPEEFFAHLNRDRTGGDVATDV